MYKLFWLALTLVLAITLGAAQYRYARLGTPFSLRWRLLLFVLGTAFGVALCFTFLAYFPQEGSKSERSKGSIALFISGVSLYSGLGAMLFMPRGLRLSLETAERNRARRENNK